MTLKCVDNLCCTGNVSLGNGEQGTGKNVGKRKMENDSQWLTAKERRESRVRQTEQETFKGKRISQLSN